MLDKAGDIHLDRYLSTRGDSRYDQQLPLIALYGIAYTSPHC